MSEITRNFFTSLSKSISPTRNTLPSIASIMVRDLSAKSTIWFPGVRSPSSSTSMVLACDSTSHLPLCYISFPSFLSASFLDPTLDLLVADPLSGPLLLVFLLVERLCVSFTVSQSYLVITVVVYWYFDGRN